MKEIIKMKYSFWKVLFSQWSIKNDIKSFMLLFAYQIIMVCGISIGAGGLPITTIITLFFATLTGPGKVWIQSLPISRLAGRILAYGTGARKEEGSILGGLGNLLDGDGR
jgi:hypothetical protein